MKFSVRLQIYYSNATFLSVFVQNNVWLSKLSTLFSSLNGGVQLLQYLLLLLRRTSFSKRLY